MSNITSPEEIWDMIRLEKELGEIAKRILDEYNTNTKEGIGAAIRQGAWEGICLAKGWK